ncbi:unknown protein (Partial), partial [Seminavis robusta]|eukprot:Sro2973_g341220.1 n/a (318) ;mRNA; r:58-1296
MQQRLGRGILWEQMGWMQNCYPCTWRGISCKDDDVTENNSTTASSSQSVVGLSLGSLGLQGTIHPFLGLLKSIEHLDVSNNMLQGTIPTQLAYLVDLDVLRLNNNKLAGSVPSSLCNLQQPPSRLEVDCWGSNPAVVCDCCTFCAGFPTVQPTPTPTQQPSDWPSLVPTELQEPSDIPSMVPTERISTETTTLDMDFFLQAEEATRIPITSAPTPHPTRRTQQPGTVPSPAPTYEGDPAAEWLEHLSSCGGDDVGISEQIQLLSPKKSNFSLSVRVSKGPHCPRNWDGFKAVIRVLGVEYIATRTSLWGWICHPLDWK